MALFPDTEPDLRKPRRRRRLGWSMLGVAAVTVVGVALLPAPYVILEPGPVFDTLGDVSVGGKEVPLIEIPKEQTYATSGSLSMLTVRTFGDRQSPLTWYEVATAWLDSSRAVLSIDSAYPLGVTVEQSNKQSVIDMQNSQQEAIAAALTELGYEFTTTLRVVETSPDAPADGVLLPDDIVQSVDGQTFTDVTGLRAAIAANGVDKPASVTVIRDGEEKTFEITPVLSGGKEPAPILGILVGGEFDFPFDVSIQLENVGGPSAGQMFALGIIDKLTPGSLTGGKDIAGTGTITGTGEIGPIGGIRQKMYAAVGMGADYFLAPAENCDEVTGHIPAGLTVFSVTTLHDSLAVLDALSSGSSTKSLDRCPVG